MLDIKCVCCFPPLSDDENKKKDKILNKEMKKKNELNYKCDTHLKSEYDLADRKFVETVTIDSEWVMIDEFE